MSGTVEFIDRLFEGKKDQPIGLTGKCHDCGVEVEIACAYVKDELQVMGGAVYKTAMEKPFFKCMECLEKDQVLRNYQKTEIFSRVCGYLRPVQNYNPGKKAEFKARVNFKM
jgi:hypothetical protein